MSDFEKNALTASAAALTAACVYASTIQPPLVPAGEIYTGQMMGLMAQGSTFGAGGVSFSAPNSQATALLMSKLGAVGKTAAVSKTLIASSLLKGGLVILAGGSILLGVGIVITVAVVVSQEIKKKK